MKVISAQKSSVQFAENEMEFTIFNGRITNWQARKPTPSEYKKSIKQYHAIQKRFNLFNKI